MNNKLITFTDLQAWTSYKSVSAIKNILTENGIKYALVNKGVSTTIDAINAGLGVIDKTTERVISF